MKKQLVIGLMAAFCATPAFAALKVGDMAPDFTAAGSLGGKDFNFNLKNALKKGPVVVYFFPAAYTKGCQIETHLFSEAVDQFKAQKATVIGITAGNTEKLAEFSKDTEYCAGKFPMALDAGAAIAKQYDATLPTRNISSRTSYVIAKNGTVASAYSAMDPNDHVNQTLAALKTLNGKK